VGKGVGDSRRPFFVRILCRMIKKISIALFAMYGLVIAYVSLAPLPEGAPITNDKVAHLAAYALFVLLAAAMALPRRTFLVVCVLIIAYSGLLEVVQSFIPGRHMSLMDLVANTLGVALGMVMVRYILVPLSGVGRS